MTQPIVVLQCRGDSLTATVLLHQRSKLLLIRGLFS